MSEQCPSLEKLRGLIDETLPADEQAALQAHVDSCEACQKSLEALVAGTESWESAVGHLREDSQVASDPELAEAVRRIKADEFSDPGVGGGTARPLDFLEPSDQPGSLGRLGPYEVSEVVGQGGMGVVVKAFDPALHRVVAVKVLAPYLANNPQARKRFIREAQAIAAVSHDHVITIHGIDESIEQPKIVMQFIAGRSLQEKLDREGSLDLKEILRIGMQTASGLAAAHSQGLVHRDVKPSNILLENGIQRVKLTDFGLARAVDDASLTQSGVIAGTPQYMAPEQANGDGVDHRADLFSLGSVMYAMCVGHSPFRASTTMGVLKRVCHDAPRPIHELNPDIPDWLCAIVMKLLAKSPADRFQSARQVADLLEKWLAHVQQPNVAPRPVPIDAASAYRTAAEPAPRPQPAAQAEELSDTYSRTILFQPISGRMFLFYLFAGIAGVVAFGRSQNMTPGEMALISIMGGLLVAFWMLLFSALVRFLWAHGVRVVHWARGTKPSDKPKGPPTRGLPPESLAMLAAIAAMILQANVLVAAIIAIVVWRIAKAWAAAPSKHQDTLPMSDPPEDNAATAKTQTWSEQPANWLQRLGSSLGSFFDLDPAERNKLLIMIGWCLSGALDLFWVNEVIDDLPGLVTTVVLLTVVAFIVLSFATASCIYVRQNYDQVKGAAFLGLLPLSMGAILRIPVSIVTLLWLHRPGTRESFSPVPWHQSDLGRLLSGQHERFRPLVAIVGWVAGWTAVCIAGLALYVVGYVIPYGPSMYSISDQSVQVISNKAHDLEFGLRGTGFGSGKGIRPSRINFSLGSLTLVSPKPGYNMELALTTPVTVTLPGQDRELTQGELEKFFERISGDPHPAEAASLHRTIQQLRNDQLAVRPTDPMSLSQAELNQDRNRALFDASSMVLPEFVEYFDLSTFPDKSVFQVQRQQGRAVYFSLNPADWFMVPLLGMMLIIWLSGIWFITSWKKRKVSKPSLPAELKMDDGPTSLGTAPMGT